MPKDGQKLAGNITFWHSLAQSPCLEVIQQAAKEFEAKNPNKKLTQEGVYGLYVPMGSNDFIATRFLNLYVRSGSGSLLTKELKVDLTSP